MVHGMLAEKTINKLLVFQEVARNYLAQVMTPNKLVCRGSRFAQFEVKSRGAFGLLIVVCNQWARISHGRQVEIMSAQLQRLAVRE